MKKIHFILAALIISMAVSCDKGTQTVNVKRYRIDLPGFLTKTTGLNDAASLQYKNEPKEFYVLVIDEPRKTFEDILKENAIGYEPNLEGYSNLLIESLEKGAAAKEKAVITDKKINGLNARVASVTGVVDGIAVFWKIAYVEGKNTYYQVLCWTLPQKQTEHEPLMDNIINSFKETDKSRK